MLLMKYACWGVLAECQRQRMWTENLLRRFINSKPINRSNVPI